MNSADLGFAVASLVLFALVLIRSRYYRALVFECLLHPRSDGWIDYEDDGSIYMHRGESLPDYMLVGALQALEETERAVLEAKQYATAQPTAQMVGASAWWPYASAAVAAGIGFVSAYLAGRDNSSAKGKG